MRNTHKVLERELEHMEMSHKREMQTLVDVTKRSKELELEAYRKGEKNSLKRFLNDRMICSLDDTNVDGSQLPPVIRSALSLRATGKPISKDPISNVWRPPKYEEAEDYVFDVCKAWKERFWMGTRFGETLFGVARGYVSCQETLENLSGQLDLHGFGTMEWDGGNTDVFVLGRIGGSGTALLLDRMGNVWLYNHPEYDR